MNKIFKYLISAEATNIHLFLLLFFFALPLTNYNIILAVIISVCIIFYNYIYN